MPDASLLAVESPINNKFAIARAGGGLWLVMVLSTWVPAPKSSATPVAPSDVTLAVNVYEHIEGRHFRVMERQVTIYGSQIVEMIAPWPPFEFPSDYVKIPQRSLERFELLSSMPVDHLPITTPPFQ